MNAVGTLIFSLSSFGQGIAFMIGWQVCYAFSPVACDGTIDVAVVVLTFAGVFMLPYQFYALWRHVNWPLAWVLTSTQLIGVIVGSLVLFTINSPWIARILGMLLFLVSIEKLIIEIDCYYEENIKCDAISDVGSVRTRGQSFEQSFYDIECEQSDAVGQETVTVQSKYVVDTKGRISLVCFIGFLSGVMNGLFGSGGPPLMWFVAYADMAKDECRGTIAFVFTVAQVFRVIVVFLQTEVPIYNADYAVLFVLLSITSVGTLYFGNKLAAKVNQQTFRRLIILLLVFGSLMLTAFATNPGIKLGVALVGMFILMLISVGRFKWITRSGSVSTEDDVNATTVNALHHDTELEIGVLSTMPDNTEEKSTSACADVLSPIHGDIADFSHSPSIEAPQKSNKAVYSPLFASDA